MPKMESLSTAEETVVEKKPVKTESAELQEYSSHSTVTDVSDLKPKKPKSHNGLRIFMPAFAAIYGVLGSAACSIFIMRNRSLANNIYSNICEIVFIVLTMLFAIRVLPKAFPEMRSYTFKAPHWYTVIALLFAMPLLIILKYRAVYLFATYISHSEVSFEVFTYSAEELKEDLVACGSAILLAPIYEELCFRYIPLSVFKRKIPRIIVCILIGAFFGWLHADNLVAVFIDAIFYAILFLASKNIWNSIAAHSANNLIVTVFAVMSYYGVEIRVQHSKPMILFMSTGWTILFAILAVSGLIIFFLGRKLNQSKKERT